MDTESISSISAVTPVAVQPVEFETNHLSPAELALQLANSKERESTEQLANDGDQLAIAKLLTEEHRSVPIDEQVLFPAPSQHAAGAREAGKGDLIDIYD